MADEQRENPAPPGIDISIPHSARMYDWWLGGKTNYAPDRALGEMFMQAIPSIQTMARENRKFLSRAVRYLVAEAGIGQFLDIGTGIPTEGNTHEVAQQINPDARVVYVDNDPIVLAHAQALMVSNDRGETDYIHADLREPKSILDDKALRTTLDLEQPVGLMMVAVLMLLDDAQDPWAKARTLMDAVPSGSYLAITHPGHDFDPDAMNAIRNAAAQGNMTVVPRVREDVARFFEGWEMVEPGLVPVKEWRPDLDPSAAPLDPSIPDPNPAYYWCGVARKP